MNWGAQARNVRELRKKRGKKQKTPPSAAEIARRRQGAQPVYDPVMASIRQIAGHPSTNTKFLKLQQGIDAAKQKLVGLSPDIKYKALQELTKPDSKLMGLMRGINSIVKRHDAEEHKKPEKERDMLPLFTRGHLETLLNR